eukprot:4059-Amphidinium_carterae.1
MQDHAWQVIHLLKPEHGTGYTTLQANGQQQHSFLPSPAAVPTHAKVLQLYVSPKLRRQSRDQGDHAMPKSVIGSSTLSADAALATATLCAYTRVALASGVILGKHAVATASGVFAIIKPAALPIHAWPSAQQEFAWSDPMDSANACNRPPMFLMIPTTGLK